MSFSLKKKFLKGYFITIKAPATNKRFNTIGGVYDHIKKISKDFVLVEEYNKTRHGTHYHAVILPFKKPARGWFKKGIHFNVKKVNGSDKENRFEIKPPVVNHQVCLTAEEKHEMASLGVLDDNGRTPTVMALKVLKSFDREENDTCCLTRLARYMGKEASQYTECINGKYHRSPARVMCLNDIE